MKPRPVTIHELVLLEYDGLDARLRVRCSSGTYIRSLARDIARALGSRARLETLERLSVGPFALDAAKTIEDFAGAGDLLSFDVSLAPRLGLNPVRLAASAERSFANGGRLSRSELAPLGSEVSGPFFAVFSGSGDFLGVVEEGEEGLAYRFVLARPSGGGPA